MVSEAGSVFMAGSALGSITFDLAAMSIKRSGTTGVFTVADPKYIPLVLAGDIIRLRLYATVTRTDAFKFQTLRSATGSLLSTIGGVTGDFKLPVSRSRTRARRTPQRHRTSPPLGQG